MRKNKSIIAEIVGWYGMAAILAAYMLVSFDVLSPDGAVFQLLNLTGAVGILVVSLYKKVMQTAVLNIIWIAIAVIALVRLLV